MKEVSGSFKDYLVEPLVEVIDARRGTLEAAERVGIHRRLDSREDGVNKVLGDEGMRDS